MSNRDYYQNPNKNPYRYRGEQPNSPQKPVESSRKPINFNEHRICPSCGKIIKIDHKYCKFCGADIGLITPIGRADEVTRTLSDTAISDPSPEVRKEAVTSLAEVGEYEVLGVLSYILLNDPDHQVRVEAANHLGKFHHPHSLDVFARALRDINPNVRRKAIEGLKNIKKMTKKRENIEKEMEKPRSHEVDVEEIPIVDDEKEQDEIDEESDKNLVKETKADDDEEKRGSPQVKEADYYEL